MEGETSDRGDDVFDTVYVVFFFQIIIIGEQKRLIGCASIECWVAVVASPPLSVRWKLWVGRKDVEQN